MIHQIKDVLGKLSLGLKILSSFVLASIALSLFAPYILDKFSPVIAFKTEVGFKILKDTLLYSHTFIGLVLVAIFLILAYLLYQLTEYVDKFHQNIERMSLKELTMAKFQDELEKILIRYNEKIQNIQLKEEEKFSHLKSRASEILELNLELENTIREVDSINFETKNLFDEFEKSLGRGGQENIIYQTGQKFNTVSENIFKIQLHVFNLSLESFRDGDAGPEKLSLIAKDLEDLVGSSTSIIEDVSRTLEEYEDSKSRNKNEIIERLIESGRCFTKLNLLVSKFWSTHERLRLSFQEFRKEMDLSSASPLDLSSLRESEAESMRVLFNDIFYKTDFVVKSLQEMLNSPDNKLSSDTPKMPGESKEQNEDQLVNHLEDQIIMKEELHEEVAQKRGKRVLNWNKLQEKQKEELILEEDELCNQKEIEEVIKQNQMSLMSIDPKQLAELMK